MDSIEGARSLAPPATLEESIDFYAAYYARYFGRYYTYYYGKMDSENFDDPIPLPEKEGKGLDIKGKR